MRKLMAAALAAGALAAPLAAKDVLDSPDPGDWPLYTRDYHGDRYVPMTDINRSNVDQLQEAWTMRIRPEGGGSLMAGSVPLVIDGIMYMTVGNAIVALDGATGGEVWRHHLGEGENARRAVTYWPGDADIAPRIFYNPGDGIVALKAATGDVDTTFGDNGKMTWIGTDHPTDYSYPPSVFRDTLVIGAFTPELPEGPDGDTRAYDARTGEFKWAFNTIPHEGEFGNETWLDDGWKERPGANMWIWYTTADPATDTLYFTVGSPGPNYYGGDRPGSNLFSDSLIAVDIATGERKWHFQAIHHELWDWDLPSPPTLVDVTKDGVKIPALALTGKNGLMYILNRETGEPVFGINEQFVAAADVPGEWYSPTQPIPVKPEALQDMWWDPSKVVTADDTSAQHAQACHDLLDSYGGTFFNAGPFTPFFLHKDGDPPRASINRPHNGGSVWGGTAADPTTGYFYINITEGGSIGWIEARDPEGNYGNGTQGSWQPYDRGSLTGPGAYSGFTAPYETEDGRTVNMSCLPPPWGHMIAVDGNTGEIAWKVPLGTTPQLPEGKRNTGANNASGGAMVTAGGLVFIGATSDGLFRAFDSRTGEIVWEEQLDYAANTIPISYRGSDGKQYIAVVAASGTAYGTPRNAEGRPANEESLIVWALPN